MANVGKLTVSLTTLTGKFGEGFREAGKHLKEFGARAHELGAKVAEVGKKLLEFGGIAEAVSLGGIAYLTHEAMESIEKTGHMADTLGTTTEALLGMQYAAKHAGVGAEEFGQSMRHLEKEIGNPTKEVNEALAKIHLSAATLNGQDASKQFDRIAHGIGALGTQSEKAAVAAALFGRQGVQLVSIFDDYEGIDAYVERVKQLGGAFSSIDAAQVREANHAIEDMHTVFDSIFVKLASKFSPFITEAANALIGMGKDGTSVADSIGNGFVDATRKMLRLVDTVDALKAAFYGLGTLVYKFLEGTSKLSNMFDHLGTKTFDLLGDTFGNTKTGSKFRELANRKWADGQHTSDITNEWGDLASKAGAVATEKLRSALDGDRSMAWQKTFDDIIAKAHARASGKVGEAGERRSANTAEERRRLGEQVAKGFADMLSRSKKWVSNTVGAANGGIMVSNWLKHGLAFMKTLPTRAFEMGWRPPGQVETTARGTFSGELAGRMSAASTIQEKQLEESKKQTKALEQLYNEWQRGVVLP